MAIASVPGVRPCADILIISFASECGSIDGGFCCCVDDDTLLALLDAALEDEARGLLFFGLRNPLLAKDRRAAILLPPLHILGALDNN